MSQPYKRGGFYYVDGKPYPSVTQIIGCLDKPGLRYAFGREVYRAFAKNPEMGEKEALAAPYVLWGQAAKRGSAVHKLIEAWETRIVGITDPELQGYMEAFRNWIDDLGVVLSEHERTVVSRKHIYAGTLDLLVAIGRSRVPLIVDAKTGKDIYPETQLQLSAYRQALNEEGIKTRGCGALLLKDNGKYRWEPLEYNYLQEFLAAKKLWLWQNKEEWERMKT